MNINDLNEAMHKWDKMESASTVFYMFGWGKPKKKEDEETSKNEKEEPDYRDKTHGERNSRFLKKARIYANTPQARLKRERTEYNKEMEQ